MQGQVTTTHEILRDRKAIVPLPQYAQFIEDSALVIACVGGGFGKGRLVNDTVKEEHAFLAYETVCVYNNGHEVGTSGESVYVIFVMLGALALAHSVARGAKGISAVGGSMGASPRRPLFRKVKR